MRTIRTLLLTMLVGTLLPACNTEGGAGTAKAHRDGTRSTEDLQERRETDMEPELHAQRGEAAAGDPVASRQLYRVQSVDPETRIISLQPIRQGRPHPHGETMILTFSEYGIQLEGRGDPRAPEPGSILAITRDERHRIRRIDVLPELDTTDAREPEQPQAPSFRR